MSRPVRRGFGARADGAFVLLTGIAFGLLLGWWSCPPKKIAELEPDPDPDDEPTERIRTAGRHL